MTELHDTKSARGDLGETNRGIGQEIVGEASPGPRPLDPAAGGPGSGSGASVREPKHQQPLKSPPADEPKGAYGQG